LDSISLQIKLNKFLYLKGVNAMKFLGHPVHPMLIVFPLGLLATGVIFDVIFTITGNPVFPTVSYWMITAGIIGGLIAAIFGFIDWLGIRPNTRAKNIGVWHGLGNLLIVSFFAVSWYLRSQVANHVPNTTAFTLSLLAALFALVTAWLGGELVYRLNTGVDKGANPNAPNSLSDQPAKASTSKTPVHR
jgi:uncharacterized membrane protein